MAKEQKKKVLGIFAVILCLCAGALATYIVLNNQNEKPEHTHEYSAEYKRDEVNHWFECECGEKSEVENHTFVDGVCICGYEEGHVHNFNETKYDANNHWFECECGEKDQVESHTFVSNKCWCGYEKEEEGGNPVNPETPTPPTHSHNYESKFNETHHWKECACGDKKEEDTHKGGKATCTEKAECIVCGGEYGEKEDHDYKNLNYDENDHWNECECGEKNNQKPHSGGSATCAKKAICDVCGNEYGECLPHVFIGNRCECGAYEPTYYTEGLSFELAGGEYVVTGYKGSSAEVVIPAIYKGKPVTIIGLYAFSWCMDVTSIYIPNSITIIDQDAFNGCTNLLSIEIPDSVVSIGADAFYYCNNLASVKLPKNLTRIEERTFADCNSLVNIEIPDGVTSIGKEAFYNCTSLTSVNLPKRLTEIESGTFIRCSFTSIEIPNSVTSIGASAFCECDFTSIEIPNSVTSIGASAFDGCNLSSVEIPKSVISIIDNPFEECASLTSIKVAENNINYKSIDGNLYTKDGKTLVSYAMGKTATSFSIPSSVELVGVHSFSGCKNLISVETPNSVTTIEGFAFSWCDNLKSIVIPDSVISIGDAAFQLCYNLESLVLGNNLKKIGESAFQNCSKLTKVIIPISVTNISAHSFAGCSELTIYCRATRQPSGWVSFHSVKRVVWGYKGN